MCDGGEGGVGGCHITHPPPPPEKKKKSTDVTIMCFFIFELLMDVEEELIRRIDIIFRRASFSFSSFFGFLCF